MEIIFEPFVGKVNRGPCDAINQKSWYEPFRYQLKFAIIVLGSFDIMPRVDSCSDQQSPHISNWYNAIPVPLVLGLILGKQAEKYFTISFSNWGLGFLSRPAVIVMLALSFFVTVYPFFRKRKGQDLGS